MTGATAASGRATLAAPCSAPRAGSSGASPPTCRHRGRLWPGERTGLRRYRDAEGDLRQIPRDDDRAADHPVAHRPKFGRCQPEFGRNRLALSLSRYRGQKLAHVGPKTYTLGDLIELLQKLPNTDVQPLSNSCSAIQDSARKFSRVAPIWGEMGQKTPTPTTFGWRLPNSGWASFGTKLRNVLAEIDQHGTHFGRVWSMLAKSGPKLAKLGFDQKWSSWAKSRQFLSTLAKVGRSPHCLDRNRPLRDPLLPAVAHCSDSAQIARIWSKRTGNWPTPPIGD